MNCKIFYDWLENIFYGHLKPNIVSFVNRAITSMKTDVMTASIKRVFQREAYLEAMRNRSNTIQIDNAAIFRVALETQHAEYDDYHLQ